MTSVLIIVLNWNGIEDTEKCITTLLKQGYENYKILIVDNGSKDDSKQRIQTLVNQHPDKLTALFKPVNKGFAGGVNTGITYGLENNFDAIVLFNNDAVADEKWLSNLVNASNTNDASITTGLLLHADGKTIDSTGDFYSTWGIAFPRQRGALAETAPESGFVFGASGGSSLYKSSLFKDIGLFDETFFAYYEDADISFRAQLAGHKVYYTKEAVAYHKQGATSNKIPGFTVYQTFKNLPLLFWKNIPGKLLIKVGSRFTLLYILIFGNAIKNGSGLSAFKGMLASIGHFWKSALRERIHIQKNKKVSVEYIASILYPDLPPEQTGMRRFRKLFTVRK